MTNDLTRGNPMKVLLAFSLPMLAGNVVQQFYNMVDLVIVGRFVGVNALAAVGATGSTMFFVFSLVFGLTGGAAVVIGQYYGSGDREKTRRAVAASVYALGGMGVILTVFGVAITRPVLRLMNTPPEILDGAVQYLGVIFLGILATVAYNGAAAILRALGDSVTPLIFLAAAAVSNIFLDLLFVVGFGWGVAGAAWATVLAQALSAAACILYAVRKLPILRLGREDFVLDRLIFGQIVRLGIPGGIQHSVYSMGAMVVQSAVNAFGPQVVAAFSSATKLDQLTVQPLISLAAASASFTAQNMGAGRIDRVRKGFWSAAGGCAAFGLAMAVILSVFGRALMTLFVDGSEIEVLAVGAQYLRIVSPFYGVVGVLILLENMLRGAGDVLIPVFSNGLEVVVRVGVVYLLSAAIGPSGIWWAAPVSWIAGLLVCGARYLSGKWQYKALISGGAEQTAPELGPETEVPPEFPPIVERKEG